MDQLLPKALVVFVVGMTWWQLAGCALFGAVFRPEATERWSWGARIWVAGFTMLAALLLSWTLLEVHFSPATDGYGVP